MQRQWGVKEVEGYSLVLLTQISSLAKRGESKVPSQEGTSCSSAQLSTKDSSHYSPTSQLLPFSRDLARKHRPKLGKKSFGVAFVSQKDTQCLSVSSYFKDNSARQADFSKVLSSLTFSILFWPVPSRFQWWLVPLPFGILIFVYDEIRKLGVRRHPGSKLQEWVRRGGGQVDIRFMERLIRASSDAIPNLGSLKR